MIVLWILHPQFSILSLLSSILEIWEAAMKRILALALLLAGASLVRADRAPPEALLSSGTQVYFRWDGAEAHRAAREKSELGKMIREDAATFLVGLFPQLIESVATNQTTQLLNKGVECNVLVRTQV